MPDDENDEPTADEIAESVVEKLDHRDRDLFKDVENIPRDV